MVFNGDYRWAGYRENNTITLPPNPRYQWENTVRTERSTGSFEGTPAIHYRITSAGDYAECCLDNTVITTKGGRVSVTDRYYDASTFAFLGGMMTETIKGNEQPAMDLSGTGREHHREDKPEGEMGITPFGEMNITLTYGGTESVTVPSGTYPAARKYTGSFRDGTEITFWVAPGVPVPVQYQFPNKYLDGVDPFQSFELIGWG